VLKVLKVLQEQQALKVHQVILVLFTEQQVVQEHKVLQEQQELKEQQDQQELKE
jgi:hypothetical protein